MDVFQRLAKKLSETPEGFPATENGIELKILKIIFSEAEAETALDLTPLPETAAAVAKRLNRSENEIAMRLDVMARKGQIGRIRMGGQPAYFFLPFIVGIYESQRGERLTRELALLFEEYSTVIGHRIGDRGPALARVLPSISEAELHHHTVILHDDLREIVAKARSFKVQNCICRTEMALIGKPCRHPLKTCLAYSMQEGAFEDFNLDGEVISREEVIRILEEAEKDGMVHTMQNVKNAPAGFICNCCPCCCGLLRALREEHIPHMVGRSDYVARIDPDKCSACGLCGDERCPVGAITEDGGVYVVHKQRCIGCGVCAAVCPTDAIELIERPPAEREPIGEDKQDWNRMRREEAK